MQPEPSIRNPMNERDKNDKSRNPDPITGAPGSHPVGTGIGAAVGGAAATGAAAGMAAGPVGAALGAAAGAVAGGLVGKGIAEKIDPTREESYWREHHDRQEWAKGRPYDHFGPAYRAGYEGYCEWGCQGMKFEDKEAELRRRYETRQPALPWEEARPATRAAWYRLEPPRDPNRPANNQVDTYGNPRPR
jgi:hypothetical protein